MKVVSINVAQPRTILVGGRSVATGIYKTPVAGRVHVGALGVDGDGQADLENHGGTYKAVYTYSFEHYEYWSRELGRADFNLGQFGENLTVEGLLEDQVCIGDTFRIGEVLLEVTQPRVPCFKLAHKMQLPQFPKLFTISGRTGFYQRVLATGEIGAGDAIERVKSDPRGLTVRDLMRVTYGGENDPAILEKAVAIPALTPGWREEIKERLAIGRG